MKISREGCLGLVLAVITITLLVWGIAIDFQYFKSIWTTISFILGVVTVGVWVYYYFKYKL
jgi:hypothetical protein